jgi:hypothetical protein
MPKLGRVNKPDGKTLHGWIFQCPGCGLHHIVTDAWTFNDDLESPTFQPSLLVTTKETRCHSFITDGSIRFLGDCTHDHANETMPLVEWDGWGGY